MKAQAISRSVVEDRSVMLREHLYDNFLKIWHYHLEIELVVIRESTGTRFVGDSIEKFEEGEIVMIGKNLPHLWLNDPVYFSKDSDLQARAQVLHFNKNFPDVLSSLPEMEMIIQLFNRAKRGIKFKDPASNYKVIAMIDAMFHLQGLERYLKVLDVLRLLAEQQDYELLSSPGFIQTFTKKDDKRMMKVLEYVMENITRNISLQEVASQINMNPSSFSRYFKRANKKTFTQFLNEIRIGFACKLLIEKRYNISEICYRSGFNNVSNFNRRFKDIKGMTPTDYIKKHSSR